MYAKWRIVRNIFSLFYGNNLTVEPNQKTVIAIDSIQCQFKRINKLLAIIIDKNQHGVYSYYTYYIIYNTLL
jgi:hypothetical protein